MRIIFMGRRPHSIQALSWLLQQGHQVVRVVAPSGTGNEVPYWSPTLRDFAVSCGLPVVSDTDIYGDLQHTGRRAAIGEIDLVVSFLFWKRIKPALIDLPRFGCINFHPAPLPDYKGLGGYNFAILDKLSEWGVAAHYVDPSFDTGPIIDVARFPFDWRTATAFSLEQAARIVTVSLFKDVVARVAESGTLPAARNSGGRYIDRSEMENAKRLDLGTMSPDEIDLRVRAFWYPPFDGAYVEINGQRFTLASRAVLEELKSLHRAEVT